MTDKPAPLPCVEPEELAEALQDNPGDDTWWLTAVPRWSSLEEFEAHAYTRGDDDGH